jgi:UDP-N-acetylmuramate--alanine ligase
MSGLAKLLAQAGHSVSGSDLKPGRALGGLTATGVETWVGHRPQDAGRWDLVVRSSAVPDRDPEAAAAQAAGIPVWERPRLLAEMTAAMPALGIAGTHGKTTTSAMAVAAMRALGRDPSFMVGGELVGLRTNAHLGEPDLFVLEADEAFGTFLDLTLRGLVVTNVEADHLDYYADLGAVEDAFASVASRVEGPAVACVDDPGAARLAERVPGIIGFGVAEGARWRVTDVTRREWGVGFTLEHGARRWPVSVGRPGRHVALNAAAVLALTGELGLDVDAAASGLAGFAGVRRRFEVKARYGGITVVDDYAHHPTEVAATIAAARDTGAGRVVAVFQPHRYSRTAELAAGFGPALANADHVVVADVYAAGEAPVPGVTGRLVADAVRRSGVDASYVPRRIDLAEHVAAAAAPGDIVLVMGAGDITLIADELAGLLGERP